MCVCMYVLCDGEEREYAHMCSHTDYDQHIWHEVALAVSPNPLLGLLIKAKDGRQVWVDSGGRADPA